MIRTDLLTEAIADDARRAWLDAWPTSRDYLAAHGPMTEPPRETHLKDRPARTSAHKGTA